jgi:hypothetical protein
MLTVSTVSAFQVYKDSDWMVRWDNTLKYSAGFRLLDQDSGLIDDINADDGDRNFDPGLISNRLDILSELDVTYHNFGVRVSGAGWLDSSYLLDNDNDSRATFNGADFGNNDEFTDETETLHGRKVELLDAFFFGKGELGDFPASFRIGRHTVLWGESLFFGANGIMKGQAPIDVVKGLSVPSTQFKELIMPVGQVSGQLQLSSDLSLAGFWQLEWRRNRIPASGSYFSDVDMMDAGGERLLLGPNPAPALSRGNDLGGGDTTSEFGEGDIGQFGISTRFHLPKLDNVEFGLYYMRFHEKSTYWLYLDPARAEYSLVFPENIHLIGASFSTQIGPFNVGGDLSGRMNTPLVSSAQVILPGIEADNDDHPLYAVGNTLHANLSATYLMGNGPRIGSHTLWDGGSVLAEVGWDYLESVTENDDALDPTRDRWALGFRMLFEPAYYQVFQGIDIRVPIGLGYNPRGRSPVDLKFNNGGADEGGDVSVGLNVDYLQVWKFGIKYTNFFGGRNTQTLADRDFITLSVQRTF